MNKHNYIIVMGLIAIVLLILTNFITGNFVDTKSAEILIDIGYVIVTGGIGFFLYEKFVKK